MKLTATRDLQQAMKAAVQPPNRIQLRNKARTRTLALKEASEKQKFQIWIAMKILMRMNKALTLTAG